MSQRACVPTPVTRIEEAAPDPRERGIPRGQRPPFWRYLRETRPIYVLGAPVIYGMAVPLMVLDLSATVYQHLCFRIYGIPRLRRLDYLVLDRHGLPYLNLIEKLHCLYCSYANQVIAYAREIIARSEQFFCPIKHARPILDPHRRTGKFVRYGDAQAYFQNLLTIRRDWDR
jgi:hypothetical protein